MQATSGCNEINPRCPRILFSEAEVKALYKPWSRALVVKVLERSFSLLAVKRRLEYLWARTGQIQVSDMANNFFLVRFTNEEDYSNAAFGGPWKIYDYYISVAQWSPSFNEEEPIKSILTWVRLPKLPIQYFNSLAVHRIGNCIGRTVRMDLATEEGARCRYARVCVEVDITKPLLGKYMIEDREFKIEYESLENMCFECGCYGHKRESCGSTNKQPGGIRVEEKTMEPEPTSEIQVIGEWMTVQRRNRKKAVKGKSASAPMKSDGSRFSPPQQTKHTSRDSPTQPKVTTLTRDPKGSHAEEAQLKKLKEVLDAALATLTVADKKVVKGRGKQKEGPREPMRDISNEVAPTQSSKTPISAGSSQSQKVVDLDSETGLIPVTVVYQNPAFQSQEAIPKPAKAKAKAVRKNAVGSVRNDELSPALLGNRKRTFKKNTSAPSHPSSGAEQNKPIGNPADDTRKPPDRL
ncbi:hypothetical protein LINPERPRIM_LOCUS31818 [Linum perenne]